MKKRAVSLVLAVIMLCSLLPLSAMAAESEPLETTETIEGSTEEASEESTETLEGSTEETTETTEALSLDGEAATSGACGKSKYSDNLTWTLADGTLTISGTGDMADYDWKESGASPWSSSSANITKVKINVGVTSIGIAAFAGCNKLSTVSIPSSVTSIGNMAFYNCSSLESATIGDKVTSIGADVFRNCSALEAVYYAGTAEQWAALTERSDGNSDTLSTEIMHYNAQHGACGDNLTWTLEGNTLTISGTGAMWDFDEKPAPWYDDSQMLPDDEGEIKLESDSINAVVIGDGVTSIGRFAFSFCGYLQKLTIGSGVTSIGEGGEDSEDSEDGEGGGVPDVISVFEGCDILAEIIVVEGNETYSSEDGVLFNADGSELILYPAGRSYNEPQYAIPDGVKTIAPYAFFCTGWLTNVTIPEDVTSIGEYAFAYAFCNPESTVSVTIPDSVTSIGDHAFFECQALTDVTLGAGVEDIGEHAFSCCYTLTELALPEGLKSLGSGAFEDCTALESVNIPKSVTSIGIGAFAGCSSLESAVIPEGITSISERMFDGCSALKSVTIPLSVTTIEADAFNGCDALTELRYAGTNERWEEIDIASGNDVLERNNLAKASLRIGAASGRLFVEVVYGDVKLVEGTDYTAKITQDKSGAITAAVKGIGDYAGRNSVSRTQHPGDIDGKDGVNISDVMTLLKSVAGVTGVKVTYTDVNGSGGTDISDVMTLLKYVAGVTGVKIY